MANEVFISYSRKDFTLVDGVKKEIDSSVGIDCWMDLNGIESGEYFKKVIISAINRHETLLFMLTPNSMASDFALKELNFAIKKEKRVILVDLAHTQLNDEFLFDYSDKDNIDWNDPLQHKKLIGNLKFWYPRKDITERSMSHKRLAKAQPNSEKYENDSNTRIKKLEIAAKFGDGGAKIALAQIYENGEGVERDIDKAIDYYRSAIVHHGHDEFIDDIKALLKEKESKTKEVKSQPIHLIQPISVNGVSFNMIKVIGGTFTIGATSEQEGENPWDDERPAHEVAVADYMIGETAVTQALWEAVMGVSIQEQSKKGTLGSSLRGVGANYPMYHISWDDSQEFVTRLSQLTGKTFRLPTETEWEFAARGGNHGRGFKYAGSDSISDVAWHDDGKTFETSPVAQKQPNELGLYDMSGNIWEWCQDWYINYGVELTPAMMKSTGMSHVTRGGSWNRAPRFCRVSVRGHSTPNERVNYVGLRVVMEIE